MGHSINIQARWRRHRSDLKNQIHGNAHLQNSWNKHGEGAFKFMVAEECLDSELVEREQAWLDSFTSQGFQVFNKGECADVPMRGVVGTAHPLHGKRLTSEHREKLSISHRGFKHSDESNEKRRQALRGRKRTFAEREAISKGKLGKAQKPLTDETKAKLSQALKAHWKNRRKMRDRGKLSLL